jgi:hypothetical protein
VPRHLQQVRLAAAKEAADPRGDLAIAIQGPQVAAEDPVERFAVLPIADERPEFRFEFAFGVFVGLGSKPCLSVVGKAVNDRIVGEQIPDGRHQWTPSECKVMLCAR